MKNYTFQNFYFLKIANIKKVFVFDFLNNQKNVFHSLYFVHLVTIQNLFIKDFIKSEFLVKITRK